jgi:hypothetical protein
MVPCPAPSASVSSTTQVSAKVQSLWPTSLSMPMIGVGYKGKTMLILLSSHPPINMTSLTTQTFLSKPTLAYCHLSCSNAAVAVSRDHNTI